MPRWHRIAAGRRSPRGSLPPRPWRCLPCSAASSPGRSHAAGGRRSSLRRSRPPSPWLRPPPRRARRRLSERHRSPPLQPLPQRLPQRRFRASRRRTPRPRCHRRLLKTRFRSCRLPVMPRARPPCRERCRRRPVNLLPPRPCPRRPLPTVVCPRATRSRSSPRRRPRPCQPRLRQTRPPIPRLGRPRTTRSPNPVPVTILPLASIRRPWATGGRFCIASRRTAPPRGGSWLPAPRLQTEKICSRRRGLIPRAASPGSRLTSSPTRGPCSVRTPTARRGSRSCLAARSWRAGLPTPSSA